MSRNQPYEDAVSMMAEYQQLYEAADNEVTRLRRLWEMLRADVEEMREAQKPSPGGQQVGTPCWPRLPPSLIVALDRYCRWALDKK